MAHGIASAVRRSIGGALLRHKLSVRQHARYDARRATPAEDIPASTELRIAEHFAHKRDGLERARTRALRTERVAGIAAQLTGEPDACADIVAAARATISADFQRFSESWRQSPQRIDVRRRDLDDFKTENLLTRDASYHASPWLGASILLIMFLAESICNTHIFADISPFGDVGGFINAAAITLPTIAAGVLTGFCGLRALHHVRPGVRVLGALVVAAGLGLALFWNLFAAHVRLLATPIADADDGTLLGGWNGTLGHLIDNPLAPLDSPPAMLLMAVGLISFVVATADGVFAFADVYPGFSRVDRKLQRALGDANRLKTLFYAKLDARIHQAIKRITGRRASIDAKSAKALQILERARDISLVYEQRAADIHFFHQQCLASYHELNARHRPASPIPSRFHGSRLPGPTTLTEFDWREAKRKIADVRGRAHAAAALARHELEALRVQIKSQLDGGQTVVVAPPSQLPPPVQSATEAA